MLIAPGYQYSQIDPNLTMTRAEHEDEVPPRSSVEARKHGYRWLASPIYQELPRRRADAPLHALGLDHAQSLRLEGPLLPAHGRDLPDATRR